MAAPISRRSVHDVESEIRTVVPAMSPEEGHLLLAAFRAKEEGSHAAPQERVPLNVAHIIEYLRGMKSQKRQLSAARLANLVQNLLYHPLDGLDDCTIRDQIIDRLPPRDRWRLAQTSRRMHDLVINRDWELRRFLPPFGLSLPDPTQPQSFEQYHQQVSELLETMCDSELLSPAEKRKARSHTADEIAADKTLLLELLRTNYDLSLITPFIRRYQGSLGLNLANQLSLAQKAERIREALIGGRVVLETFDADKLPMRCFPGELCKIVGLRTLDLYEHKIRGLPPEIGRLTALQKLRLGYSWPTELGALLRPEYNQLTALPAEIGRLTALKELVLSLNQLTALPPEIGRLTALRTLGLNDNQLTVLPREIGRLTALEWLALNDNQLTVLPREIGRLTALRTLGLEFNQLTALPPEIGRLTALGSLGLSDNRLTALPAEIGRLTALWRLELDENRLTALPAEIGRLTATAINLRGNPLR